MRWPWQKDEPRPNLYDIFDAIDAYEKRTWDLAVTAVQSGGRDTPKRLDQRQEWLNQRRVLETMIREALHGGRSG